MSELSTRHRTRWLRRRGIRTLRQDGIEQVLMGVTSIAEVRAPTNA